MKHEFRDTRTTMWSSSKTVCSVNSRYFVCCPSSTKDMITEEYANELTHTLNNLVISTFRHLIDAKLLYLERKRESERASERKRMREWERERDVCASECVRERKEEERLKSDGRSPFIYWPVTRIHYFCSFGLTKWKLINRERTILKKRERVCETRRSESRIIGDRQVIVVYKW